MLNHNVNIREEEVRRLLRAMFNLKRCREAITGGSTEPNELFWDSWDRHHHTHHTAGASPRAHRSTTRFQQQNRAAVISNEATTASAANQLATNQSVARGDVPHNANNRLPSGYPDNNKVQSPHESAHLPNADRQNHLISPEDTSVSTLTPSPSPPNSPSVWRPQRPSASILLCDRSKTDARSPFCYGRTVKSTATVSSVAVPPTSTPPSHSHTAQAATEAESAATAVMRAWDPPRLSVGSSERAGDDPKMWNPRKFPQSLLNQQFSRPSPRSEINLAAHQLQQQQQDHRITSHDFVPNSQEHHVFSQDQHMSTAACDQDAEHTTSATAATTTQASSSSSSTASTTANHVNGNANMIGSMSSMSNVPTPRSRLHTEPSPENYNDIVENPSNLTVPRSPCTPIVTRGMGHMIAHRFTKKFKVMSTCDLCNKQMFFGLKCKECKYRCHKDCESHVPPSCGLPPEFIDEFKKSLPSDVFLSNTSPNMGSGGGGKTSGGYFLSSGRRDRHRSQAYAAQYATGPDSSSAGSSCNSSSPSSPALLTIPPQTPAASKHTQFHFPEISVAGDSAAYGTMKAQPVNITGTKMGRRVEEDWTKPMTDETTTPTTVKSTAADATNAGRSTAPVRTPVIELADTTRSNESGSISASTDSVRSDSTEERESTNWPRQNSLSLKEWDIPFGDLNLLEKIGRGRFGTVHRGLWHGDVAVKLLNEDYLDDERTLEAFKLEVATFKKTRHENLVLFMGFCMKPQAIVTSLCKGNTLYTHIHLRKDKFNLYRATLVAQQISQGMGYLHAKDIVHKDLKTKNIFLENGKVIITDFGVFSAIKLQYSKEGLCISNNWLCYLAPELIRGLRPVPPAHDELQFSKASDVYAFGTVWYELLCGEFPFKRQPPEAIIFQIGRGMKQTLANIQASRDVKDILMLCWAFQPDDRPDFPKLLTLLERLPKKRLARSPSHPVQLSRSAESVF